MFESLSLNHRDITSKIKVAFGLVSLIPLFVIFYLVKVYGNSVMASKGNLAVVSFITAVIILLGWYLIKEMNRDVLNRLVQQEKLTALGQLAAGVAHEINNPLCIVLGNIQLLSKDIARFGYKDALDTIENEIDRCASIVSDLLEFSRNVESEFREININELLDETLSLIGHQLLIQDIKLVKEYGSGVPTVIGDGNRLKQVFMNIIVNAYHAMEGGGALTISSSVITSGPVRDKFRHRNLNIEILRPLWRTQNDTKNCQFIEVRIHDTGCGIREEDMQHIFEPFFTTREPGKGTGLGLSLSYGIVRQHKGDIKVESKAGEGTTFTVRLPAQLISKQNQRAS